MGRRLCKKCDTEKPESNFYGRKDGYRRFTCKPCSNLQSRKSPSAMDPLIRNGYSRRYRSKEGAQDKRRDARLRKEYGISLEEYNRVLVKQGGVCAICKTSCSRGTNLVVDHDHTSGKVRGLLCRLCNLAIGNLRDQTNLCLMAAQYLRRD